MVAAIRDSSLDYRTYWLQDGQYYSRRALGDAAPACALPEDKLRQIPEAARKVLLDEVNADPAFCRVIANSMATKPDWAHRISAKAMEAVANEMDPSKFKGSVGSWPKLRATVRSIVEGAVPSIERLVEAMPLEKKMEIVKAIAAGVKIVPKLSGLGDLGQWETLIGTVVSGISDYFGGRVIAGAQRNIAQTNANAAINIASAQVAIAEANAAMAASSERIANPISSAISTLTTSTVAGIPIIVPILGAVGVALYFAFKK